MNTKGSRSRIVVFRLTEEEYVLLKKASFRARRSISDFTRAEIMESVHGDRGGCGAAEQLSRCESTLQEVKELVLCIVTQVQREPAPRGRMAPVRHR